MQRIWRPILEGPLLDRSREAVHDLSASISVLVRSCGDRSESRAATDCSLAVGHLGLALFCAYLDKARRSAAAKEHARRFLNHSIDAAIACDVTPSLFSGLTGVAWVMNH